jgi:SAM-dependent methyltransferase
MPISDSELRTLLTAYRRENWQGIQTREYQSQVIEAMLLDGEPDVLRRIAPYWKLPPGALILDVGSGVGGFVVACRRRGLAAFGVEPDRIGQGSKLTSIEIARRRMDTPVFAAATGEQLPFCEKTFDLVVLNQVIEHVSDQEAVLREAFRVVKPEGAVYVACPNYLRFFEPHYRVSYFPLLPKPLGSWYLRLRGRNPVLLEQLTYTTNRRVRRLLGGLGAGRVIDLNSEQFIRKCQEGSFASARARMVGRLARLPGLGRLMKRAVVAYIRLREGGSEFVTLPR